MSSSLKIDGCPIAPGHPTDIIAEMSGNHNQDFEQSLSIIRTAKDAGADAVRIQTYTADTISIQYSNEFFRIDGTLWDDRILYHLCTEESALEA